MSSSFLGVNIFRGKSFNFTNNFQLNMSNSRSFMSKSLMQCTYKDKKVSIELTSVFNYLINNRFVKYGAEDEARTRDPLLGKEIFYHWTTSAIAYINYNTI